MNRQGPLILAFVFTKSRKEELSNSDNLKNIAKGQFPRLVNCFGVSDARAGAQCTQTMLAVEPYFI